MITSELVALSAETFTSPENSSAAVVARGAPGGAAVPAVFGRFAVPCASVCSVEATSSAFAFSR